MGFFFTPLEGNLNVWHITEKTCTISFDEVEGITTYNFYVGARKIGTVPENKHLPPLPVVQ